MNDSTSTPATEENGLSTCKADFNRDDAPVPVPAAVGRPREKLELSYMFDGKPFLNKKQVIRVAEDKFGLDVVSVKAMNSYEGQNFLIETSAPVGLGKQNRDVENSKYFLKFTNSFVSSWHELFVDSMLSMLDVLRKGGISCPVPVPNKTGSMWEMMTFKNLSIEGKGRNTNKSRRDVFMVRMFSYLPGVTLDDLSDIPLHLYGEMGSTLAQIHNTLKGSNISRHQLEMWGMTLPFSMNRVCQIRDILHVIEDPSRRKMILEALDVYDKHVLQRREELPKGFVHGDYSDVNLLFSTSPDQEVHLTSVIDFDQVYYDCLVYDVGLGVMYILQSKTPYKDEATALFLSEYNKHRKLTDLEKSCLFHCVVGRYVQSLVIGLYVYEQTRDRYNIATQARGWQALEKLWKNGKELTYGKWGVHALSNSVDDK